MFEIETLKHLCLDLWPQCVVCHLITLLTSSLLLSPPPTTTTLFNHNFLLIVSVESSKTNKVSLFSSLPTFALHIATDDAHRRAVNIEPIRVTPLEDAKHGGNDGVGQLADQLKGTSFQDGSALGSTSIHDPHHRNNNNNNNSQSSHDSLSVARGKDTLKKQYSFDFIMTDNSHCKYNTPPFSILFYYYYYYF